MVHAAVLGLLAHDDLEQFLVLRRCCFQGRAMYSGRSNRRNASRLRVDPLLVQVPLLPRPVGRRESCARVQDASVPQPVPVGLRQPRREELDDHARRGLARPVVIDRGSGPDRNGTTTGTSNSATTSHIVILLHPVGRVQQGRTSGKGASCYFGPPGVDAERHVQACQRRHDRFDAVPLDLSSRRPRRCRSNLGHPGRSRRHPRPTAARARASASSAE